MFTLSPEQWRALGPFLEEALALPKDERASWLLSLREENPDAAVHVEMLLQEHFRLEQEGFLERQSVPMPGLSGQRIGAYTLISEIGHGGMGSVWLAERNDGRFERRVAVKLLNIALMGRAGEERFRREGTILASLSHPHIAELIDAGVSEVGQPYLVLEHVAGEHLDLYSDRERLSIEERIRLLLDVIAAVAKAHANLIVHRDLKPSNVLVRFDGKAKLLDFGIAKLLDDKTQAGEATLTGEGGKVMTPEYAAPEQLNGGAITTATDVYALGVLLYVLLTGRHPTAVGANSPADLLRAVLEIEPTRPSDVVVSRLHPELAVENAAKRSSSPDRLRRMLRGDLDTIVAKALKKDPAERYASVTALSDDLRRYLRNEPISARPDRLSYRAIKFIRRNRSAVVLVAIAAVAAISGIVGTTLQARTARTQRDFALHQLARAERINDLNDILLTDVAPTGKPLTANELIEREERIVEREHYSNTANHVELLISIGDQYSGEAENTRGLRILQEAYQLSRGLTEKSVRGKASCALAGGMTAVGELARAEALFQEGFNELPDQPQYGPDRVFCLIYGTGIAYNQGDSKEAMSRALTAQRIVHDSPAHSPVEELNVLTQLAGAYAGAGQFREAISTFEQASKQMEDLGYDETQKAVKLFNDWGVALAYVGRPLEAEKAYRHAIDISRTNSTEDSVLPPLLYNYSLVLRDLGRIPEAADYTERAYSKAETLGDRMIADKALIQRGRIYRDKCQFARAIATLDQAEPRLRRALPPGHFAFASLISDKALVFQAEGDFATALQLANQAVEMDQAAIKSGGQGATFLPILLVRRATVELDLRQEQQAAADAQDALNLLRASAAPGTYSIHAGRAYLTFGRALQSQGKTDEARAAYRSAFTHLENTAGEDNPETRRARELSEQKI